MIIVYGSDEEAAWAKKEGDRLFLDVDLGEEEERSKRYGNTGIKHKRTKSQPPHGYVTLLQFHVTEGGLYGHEYHSSEIQVDSNLAEGERAKTGHLERTAR